MTKCDNANHGFVSRSIGLNTNRACFVVLLTCYGYFWMEFCFEFEMLCPARGAHPLPKVYVYLALADSFKRVHIVFYHKPHPSI